MMDANEPSDPAASLRLSLRPAEESDAEWLARLWASAFPGEKTAAERLRELRTSGRHGGLETCWVGELGERRVGGLRTYPFRMSLWGRELDVQGLAAVAVAPEARRRGIGAGMCREALRVGRRLGATLSVLFPFRVDFYARLGYTLAGELHRYVVAPGEVPAFPEAREARSVSADEATELVPAFYERVRPQAQGLLRRGRGLWEFLEEASHRSVVVPGADGSIRGYLVVRHPVRGERDRETLRVREMIAEDFAAHRALLGWLSLQRGQWRRIVYDALRGEHVERLLSDPRTAGARGVRAGGLWFPSATLLRGPMLRVLDVAALLESFGFPAGVRLGVDDPDLPENRGVWRRAEGGEAGGRAAGAAGSRLGEVRREVPAGPGASAGLLPVAVVGEMLLDGLLPGQRESASGWDPLLGIEDFRLLDTF